MDFYRLKQLRALVLQDLREHIPPGYFSNGGQDLQLTATIPSADFHSKELHWGKQATRLGCRLFDDSGSLLLTPRQTAASELLRYLGLLAAAGSARAVASDLASRVAADQMPDDPSVEQVSQQLASTVTQFEADARLGLAGYLVHLPDAEANIYRPLLVDGNQAPAAPVAPLHLVEQPAGAAATAPTAPAAPPTIGNPPWRKVEGFVSLHELTFFTSILFGMSRLDAAKKIVHGLRGKAAHLELYFCRPGEDPRLLDDERIPMPNGGVSPFDGSMHYASQRDRELSKLLVDGELAFELRAGKEKYFLVDDENHDAWAFFIDGKSAPTTEPAAAPDLHPTAGIQPPATPPTIGDKRRKHDRTPAEVLVMHTAMKNDGKGAHTERLAAQLGITKRGVQTILKKAKAAAQDASHQGESSAHASVFHLANTPRHKTS